MTVMPQRVGHWWEVGAGRRIEWTREKRGEV